MGTNLGYNSTHTGRSASRRHNDDSIKLGAQLPSHFGLSCLQNQQAEKGIILLVWLVASDYQEIGLLLHK